MVFDIGIAETVESLLVQGGLDETAHQPRILEGNGVVRMPARTERNHGSLCAMLVGIWMVGSLMEYAGIPKIHAILWTTIIAEVYRSGIQGRIQKTIRLIGRAIDRKISEWERTIG